MPYATDRRGFSRTGFRPALTDTFAAAQGLGRTPFDPERLGQYAPFPSGAGYHLHGLGNVIPNQSVVTWVGQVSGSASMSVADVVSAAAAALAADGLPVISQSGLPFSVFDIDLSLSSSAQVTLTLQVNNGLGYGQPSDIASIVNHEIYVASGTMPAGAVTNVQAPGAGGTAPTAPTDWSGWLQQNAVWLGLGVLGLVLLPDLLEKF